MPTYYPHPLPLPSTFVALPSTQLITSFSLVTLPTMVQTSPISMPSSGHLTSFVTSPLGFSANKYTQVDLLKVMSFKASMSCSSDDTASPKIIFSNSATPQTAFTLPTAMTVPEAESIEDKSIILKDFSSSAAYQTYIKMIVITTMNRSEDQVLLLNVREKGFMQKYKVHIIVAVVVAALWIGSCLGLYFSLRANWDIKTVVTDQAPKPLGPYSAARSYNGMLFVSGQIGIDPARDQIVSDSVTDQAHQALTNLKNILTAGGSSLERVLMTTIYLQNSMDDFAAVNTVYGQFFNNSQEYPARATVVVKQLPLKNGTQALVEISAIAAG